MRAPRRDTCIAVIALILTTSCKDSQGPPDPPAAVTVNAPATEVTVGGTVQLAAAVLNSTGVIMTGQQVEWSSLDPDVASVSAGGLVTGLLGGTARIRATAGSASGTVSLVVRSPVCAATMIAGTLAPGQTVGGTLSRSDCELRDFNLADGWSFSTTTATGLRVELSSSQFNAALVVTDMAMNIITYGEVTGEGTARLAHTFNPGSYIVWVTSYGNANTGTYSLSAGTFVLCSAATAAGTVGMDQTLTGALSGETCLLPHGLPGTGYRMSLATASSLRMSMTATGFIPLIAVTDLNLNGVAFGVPANPGGTAELMHSFAPGEYIVWATSVQGTAGTFSLSVGEARLPACSPPAGTVAVGQSVSGLLTSASCVLPDGRFADPWHFNVGSAMSLRIDMVSAQVDPYLIITDLDGRILAQDDDGGAGFNARVIHHFAAGGYIAWATTYDIGETGSYQLSVQPPPGGNVPEPPAFAAPKQSWGTIAPRR
jgi:hypothetical protein